MFSFGHFTCFLGISGHEIGKGRGEGVIGVNAGKVWVNMHIATTGRKTQDGSHVEDGGSENSPGEDESIEGS